MIIYKDEANVEGLAEKVIANTSVAYTTQLSPWSPSDGETSLKEHLYASLRQNARASEYDSDLYPTKSILVTTNWNKNDDVFSPVEVWGARNTPSHKPTNLEHNEKELVGHITETWAMDVDGVIIPDNTLVDDLPNTYHLANGAVIYLNWQDEKLVERTKALVDSIENGDKFVSMEAIFTNFGYGVVTPENDFHVVARTQETAFLTKHLRAYGGSGQFDGCKIGRVLKNITFSGKGYVDKPANPESIIFTDDFKFDYSAASTKNPFNRESGVLISCSSISTRNKGEEGALMSDQVQILQAQINELKETNKTLASKNDELVKSASEAGIKNLEDSVASLNNKLEATVSERDEALAKVEALTVERDAIASQLTEMTEAKDALAKEIETAKAEKTMANRIATLVDGGVDKAVAETKVEVYASLDDEQFAVIAEDIVAVAKMHGDKEEKEKKGKDAKASDSEEDETQDEAEASANEEVLENAEASDDDVNLNADASDQPSEEEQSRDELRSTIASFLGYEQEDKAE